MFDGIKSVRVYNEDLGRKTLKDLGKNKKKQKKKRKLCYLCSMNEGLNISFVNIFSPNSLILQNPSSKCRKYNEIFIKIVGGDRATNAALRGG